jgi:drug/metabolite transporter (DMT)-like permease
MPLLAYLLAVLAACANAASSVLQRKANRRIPRKQNLSPRLIWSLLHEPVWFGGVLAVCAGFLLQAAALGSGQLAVVEPLLVIELPFTLLLASRVFGARLHRREWGAIAGMTVSLAGFLYCLSPSAGHTQDVPWYAWVTGAGINLAFIGIMTGCGRSSGRAGNRTAAQERGGRGGQGVRRDNAAQAALLGVAAGSAFGLTAALMKGMTRTFALGIGTLLTSWELYSMIVAGMLGMFLLQSAMNAGRLIAAQPGLTLSDPIVSVLWGVLVFHERVRGGWYIAAAVACAVALAAAVLVLARSPLLAEDSPRRQERDRPGPAPAPSRR